MGVRSLQVNPNRIALIGDSAGAGLCLQLLQILRRHGCAALLPRTVVLISPWADFSRTEENDASFRINRKRDLFRPEGVKRICNIVMQGSIASAPSLRCPLVSPYFHSFYDSARRHPETSLITQVNAVTDQQVEVRAHPVSEEVPAENFKLEAQFKVPCLPPLLLLLGEHELFRDQ